MRRKKEFEDETCNLLRKTEEETVLSRLELEEHLSGASSITASEVSGGNSGLQTNHEKRKMAQVRKCACQNGVSRDSLMTNRGVTLTEALRG